MTIVTPEALASCPVCGCLVLVHSFREVTRTLVAVWDPGFGERRMIRSYLTRADVARQGFGLIHGGHHECPPEEDCALKAEDRGRRVRP
jgi:hypothetical protein